MILILSDDRTVVFLVCKQAAMVCMGIHRDKLRMYGFHYMLCVMVQVRRNTEAQRQAKCNSNKLLHQAGEAPCASNTIHLALKHHLLHRNNAHDVQAIFVNKCSSMRLKDHSLRYYYREVLIFE